MFQAGAWTILFSMPPAQNIVGGKAHPIKLRRQRNIPVYRKKDMVDKGRPVYKLRNDLRVAAENEIQIPFLKFLLKIDSAVLAPKFAPDEPVVGMSGVESRADKRAALSPFKEKAGYIIFILTTLALIFQPQLKVPIWVICITGALAMIAFGVLTEKEAIGSINWPMATPTVPMCMASGGYDIKSLMKQSLVPAIVLCLVSVF